MFPDQTDTSSPPESQPAPQDDATPASLSAWCRPRHLGMPADKLPSGGAPGGWGAPRPRWKGAEHSQTRSPKTSEEPQGTSLGNTARRFCHKRLKSRAIPTLKSKGQHLCAPSWDEQTVVFYHTDLEMPRLQLSPSGSLAGVLGHIRPRPGTAVLSLCQHGWEAHTLGPAGRPGHVWIWATDTAQPLLCIPSTFQDGSKGNTESQGSGEQRLPSHPHPQPLGTGGARPCAPGRVQ